MPTRSLRVRTCRGTLHTSACEAVFDTHPQVRRTALVGVGEAGAEEPVLCVELLSRQPRRAMDAIRAELLEIGARQPNTQYIRTLLFHRKFPVDIRHNVKIGRRQLRAWAAKQLRWRRAARAPQQAIS